jgi:tetratricopeptide (TPR) repeat protein
MARGFGAKSEDLMALIARKSYAKAIEVLRVQIEANRHDPRLRMQLADVLVLAGKGREAVGILTPLADEYARDGFAAKAIAVFKKIQKIDPGRRDVDSRLASLIQEKQRVATVSVAAASLPEIGMEEIGFEMPIGGGMAVPSEAPESALPELALEPQAALEPELEPELALEPPVLPAPRAVSAIEDPDLMFMDDLEEADELVEPEVEVEPEVDVETEAKSADPMSDGRFAEELQALVDVAFLAAPSAPEEDAAAAALPTAPSQIVVSPLFRDFSVDEMVAVIQGLNLLSYERGDVILREGAPGDSLYMLTTGMVRAFRKDPSGRQVRLGDLLEGAFFGEVSILTGGRRTATVAALTRCELLELDRPTLDSIRKTHPHVLEVLEEFARQRSAKPA